MDNEEIIEVGDLVRLKSGGPLMTVAEATDIRVDCIWYNQPAGFYQKEAFLKKVIETSSE